MGFSNELIDLEFDDHDLLPYLTLILPKDVPEVVFHIYEEVMSRNKGTFYYVRVKDATKLQILYSLYYLSPTRDPINECTLSRWEQRGSTCLIEGKMGAASVYIW